MSNKETIVALKSDERASLSPGAYQVLTGAVERADPGPLSALRMKLRAAVAGFKWLQDMAPGEYAKMAELLEAPEWMQAAEEANTLRAQNFALAAGQCANVVGDEGGTPQCEEIARLRAALLDCARQAERLKKPCGMDPEGYQAVRNGQYQNISTTAHVALGTIRGPEISG